MRNAFTDIPWIESNSISAEMTGQFQLNTKYVDLNNCFSMLFLYFQDLLWIKWVNPLNSRDSLAGLQTSVFWNRQTHVILDLGPSPELWKWPWMWPVAAWAWCAWCAWCGALGLPGQRKTMQNKIWKMPGNARTFTSCVQHCATMIRQYSMPWVIQLQLHQLQHVGVPPEICPSCLSWWPWQGGKERWKKKVFSGKSPSALGDVFLLRVTLMVFKEMWLAFAHILRFKLSLTFTRLTSAKAQTRRVKLVWRYHNQILMQLKSCWEERSLWEIWGHSAPTRINSSFDN